MYAVFIIGGAFGGGNMFQVNQHIRQIIIVKIRKHKERVLV